MICEKLTSFFVKPEESIRRCLIFEYKKLFIEEGVQRLSRAFKLRPFVLVIDSREMFTKYYIVTPKNLTDFVLLDNKN